MPDCTSIDALVTPYIDGEIAPADRRLVDDHLRACPPCHARVGAERAVRDLIGRCKPDLGPERPSSLLRARCASLAARSPEARRPAAWRPRLASLALAATIVFAVAGAFVYVTTARSAMVMAAELTADHVKCFALNSALGTEAQPGLGEQSLVSGFGWHPRAIERFEEAGLRLVGARPCLYGGGKVAHMMFRHEGRPVSVFMLPKVVRAEEILEVLGHEAAVWSAEGRTFVMIAREPRAEAVQMASMVQAALR